MTDEGKDADFHSGGPLSDAVDTHSSGTLRDQSGDGVDRGRSAKARRATRNLNPHTRDRLAAQLRVMYDTVVHQPVPDRFAELIAKLDVVDQK